MIKRLRIILGLLLVGALAVVAAENVFVLLKPKATSVTGQVTYVLNSSGQKPWYLTSVIMKYGNGYESPTNVFTIEHIHGSTNLTSILVQATANNVSNLVFDAEGLLGQHTFRWNDTCVIRNSDTNAATVIPDARYK